MAVINGLYDCGDGVLASSKRFCLIIFMLIPTGPLYDPRPKWLLCESFGLPGHHRCQPLLHSVFPADWGPRVREEYANQHCLGQVSKVSVDNRWHASDVSIPLVGT